jgi:hypothetical protein
MVGFDRGGIVRQEDLVFAGTHQFQGDTGTLNPVIWANSISDQYRQSIRYGSIPSWTMAGNLFAQADYGNSHLETKLTKTGDSRQERPRIH